MRQLALLVVGSLLHTTWGFWEDGVPCTGQHSMRPPSGYETRVNNSQVPYQLTVTNTWGQQVTYYRPDELYNGQFYGTDVGKVSKRLIQKFMRKSFVFNLG